MPIKFVVDPPFCCSFKEARHPHCVVDSFVFREHFPAFLAPSLPKSSNTLDVAFSSQHQFEPFMVRSTLEIWIFRKVHQNDPAKWMNLKQI